MLLKVTNLDVFYGKTQALRNVSYEVAEGEIVTLIGANGAGKTTSLAAISSLVRASKGDIEFHGHSIKGNSVEEIVRLGIALCPEGRRVFAGLTVQENLQIGATSWRRYRESVDQDLERVFDLFPRLRERANQLAWSLSGGEQQMLAVGRALMGRPKLLMLDEPSLGLAPIIVQQLFEKIVAINRLGVSILLVEQNAAMALEISHRGYVLETGNVILQDASNALRDDPRVKAAYLGG
jgi:branched-chain amino acid transport system ATP-binding protein